MNLALTGVISTTLFGGIMLMMYAETADPRAHIDDVIPGHHSARNPGQDVILTGSDEPGMWKSFEDLHERYTQAFVDSEGFGISRIVTFDSPERRAFLVNGRKRRIHTVQLIGLNGDVPRVYESSFINPTRSMLATTAYRPLSDFENHAIERLETGTNYVFSGEDARPGESTRDVSGRTASERIMHGMPRRQTWTTAGRIRVSPARPAAGRKIRQING